MHFTEAPLWLCKGRKMDVNGCEGYVTCVRRCLNEKLHICYV